MEQSILVELASLARAGSQQCREGSRMDEKSKQRLDADMAFLRLQAPEKGGNRAPSKGDIANRNRVANTARLRELRLQKEAQEREAAFSPVPQARKDRKPV